MLQAGRAAGWTPVTLIATDRCRTRNPDTGHDLWYSRKHKAHGGNVQVVCDPSGFPVTVSDMQPGSAHELAAARATGFLGALRRGRPARAARAGRQGVRRGRYRRVHAGQGRPAGPQHGLPQPAADPATAEGERGIALLKTRWKALHRIRLCPQRIGAIVAAALVLISAERPIR